MLKITNTRIILKALLYPYTYINSVYIDDRFIDRLMIDGNRYIDDDNEDR